MTRADHEAGISPDTGEVARGAEFIAPRLALASGHLQQERLGIMELNSHTCRWPIVKIGAEDFRYCGNRTVQGKPYCVLHCKKAYKPSVRKQRHYTPNWAREFAP